MKDISGYLISIMENNNCDAMLALLIYLSEVENVSDTLFVPESLSDVSTATESISADYQSEW